MKIKKNNIISKEFIQFYSLFFLTIFFVYYTPPGINRLYFILLLALFWNSKKDYFWFVFIFILVAQPGILFHGTSRVAIHRIPLYSITTGVSFGFFDLFFLTAFIKAMIKGKFTKLILKKPLVYLLIYMIFLFLISFYYGTNLKLVTSSLRNFTVFTLFVSFPFLVYKKEDFFKFMHLVFPIVFFIIFAQFFYLFTGSNLYYFMIGQSTLNIIELMESSGYTDFIRPMSGGAQLLLFSFIFTLFLIEKKDYPGKKWYLYLVLMISTLSIFLSATRGWIIMYAIMLFLNFIFIMRKTPKILVQVFLIIFIFLSSYHLIPRLKYSVDNSWRRLSTVEYLLEGDVTAGGTLQRIDKRLPRVLEGFEKNPVFGWGFSETFEKYSDRHVGNFNLLMQIGIIGALLFFYFWIKYFHMIFVAKKNLSKKNPFKSSILVLAVGFLGILILHFTSAQFFGYYVQPRRVMTIIILIFFSEFFIKEALRVEMSNKHIDSHPENNK